jgi:hypothetical protein
MPSSVLFSKWCLTAHMLLLLVACPCEQACAADGVIFLLVPERGTCTTSDPRVAVRSGNFPPGVEVIVQFGWSNVPPELMFGGRLGRQYVHADGTLEASLELHGCSSAMPDGAVMNISVDEYLGIGNPGVPRTGREFARVTFTVDRSSAPLPGLPNTGGGGSVSQRGRLVTIPGFTIMLLTLPISLQLFRLGRQRCRC